MNIVNVTCLFAVGRELDFALIRKCLGSNVYAPARFCALIWKQKASVDVCKVSALIFASGKIITTGGKSVEDNRAAALRLFTCLNCVYSGALSFLNFSIKNIVMSFRLKQRVLDPQCLRQVVLAFPFKFEHNPELFLGAYLRINIPDSPNALAIIFHTGSVIFTGLRSVRDCKQALFCVREIESFLS